MAERNEAGSHLLTQIPYFKIGGWRGISSRQFHQAADTLVQNWNGFFGNTIHNFSPGSYVGITRQ
jgi:hypothetical protein